jgi:NAD-dependent dihydropyrimidine dehydrogenase PreA subunit
VGVRNRCSKAVVVEVCSEDVILLQHKTSTLGFLVHNNTMKLNSKVCSEGGQCTK